jgi:hypothetical protein
MTHDMKTPAVFGPSLSRRRLLAGLGGTLGSIALSELLGSSAAKVPGLEGLPHFAPKAKRVICLFMSGGMSQYETFDHKPELARRHGEELPESYRARGLVGMSNTQASFPLVKPFSSFRQHGKSGQWLSDLLPHLGEVADELCVIRSFKSEAVNHDPAMILLQSGDQNPGRPSLGSWTSYGLGTENADLPAFIVLVTNRMVDQPLSSRLWDHGFLPSRHQGTQFRSGKDPVLFLGSPTGVSRNLDAATQKALRRLHEREMERRGEPDLSSRLAQFELAFRMQTSVPDATSIDNEPESVKSLYGPDVEKPGSFARNCLVARRLAEKGVRFVQLYHPGWDHHGSLPRDMMQNTREIDSAAAGLIKDLKQRDMLKDTLVVFCTEFGRTCYCQGSIVADTTTPGATYSYGREHHRDAFSIWMAGGGIKPGTSYGETCELGFDVVKDPVTVNDYHATILHLLGIDHQRLTVSFQGRQFRLTDVAGKVVKAVLA